jgi:tetratricopeptide (TPR) repeat protein
MKQHSFSMKLACSLTATLLFAGCMTAQDYVRKGEESSKFENSVKYFEKALELEPENIELRKTIAQNYARKGEESSKFEESVRYFDRALELDPDNIELKKSIATRYIPEIKKNNGERRKELFENARKLEPDNLDIYYANAYALLVRDRDHMAATKVFEEVLEKDPKFQCKKGDMVIAGSTFGFKNTSQFSKTWNGLLVENLSLFFPIGVGYYDTADKKNSGLSQTDKNNFLEKSLQSLQKGYDLDITQGRNNTQEAKTLYLLQMARTAERKEDYDLAIRYYTTFLNDSSIKLDKSGISDKRQPLYAKANQQTPAVASSTPPSSGSTSNQQNHPAPVDWTGSTEIGIAAEVGGVYKLNFTEGKPGYEIAIQVPPYYKSVKIFTEGNLDTDIVVSPMYILAEMMGTSKMPTDAVIENDQSSSDLNASINFPTIPQGGKIFIALKEKNNKKGIFILVVQGSR